MPDYSKGKIYKIVNSVNDKIYIGSTTRTLAQRMGDHRYAAKTERSKLYKAMRFHGIEQFSVKLVKDYSCDTEQQLLAKEFQIVQMYLSKGIVLYNTSTVKGSHADSTKRRMSKAQKGSLNHQYGKIGKANASFRRGGVSFRNGKKPCWVFSWRENGKHKSKSFSPNKYGYEEARYLAEEYRNKIYPLE